MILVDEGFQLLHADIFELRVLKCELLINGAIDLHLGWGRLWSHHLRIVVLGEKDMDGSSTQLIHFNFSNLRKQLL